MEDYMQYMKSLRMQINDVEDQASKISVEEQTQMTIIHALEKDLNSAKSTAQQITDDADLMLKRTVDIRSKILDKQKTISSFESDYASLAATLELLQQEKISLSAKLLERRMHYSELRDEMNSKLLQKQITTATDAGNIEAEERSSGDGHANYLLESKLSHLTKMGEKNLCRDLTASSGEIEGKKKKVRIENEDGKTVETSINFNIPQDLSRVTHERN